MEEIRLEQVTKQYGAGDAQTTVLRDVTLTVQAGELAAIMGPSGSGKTTLLQLIGCLDTPSTGRCLLGGIDTSTLSKQELANVRNREIGFVFQSFHLLPDYSVVENVELPLRYSDIPRSEHRRRALAALESVGLAAHAHKKPTHLSGGQGQRVAIARALVTEPKVLLADEPTGALDQATGQAILDLFKEIHQGGRTVLIVTHDPQVAAQCERVIRVQDGSLLPTG